MATSTTTATTKALTYTPSPRAEQAYIDYYKQRWQETADPARKGWWCLVYDIVHQVSLNGHPAAIAFGLEATAAFPPIVLDDEDDEP